MDKLGELLENFDLKSLISGNGGDFGEQVAKDWDAIVNMFSYLIEFFTSLFA